MSIEQFDRKTGRKFVLATQRPDPNEGLLGLLPDRLAVIISERMSLHLLSIYEDHPGQFERNFEVVHEIIDKMLKFGHVNVIPGWIVDINPD